MIGERRIPQRRTEREAHEILVTRLVDQTRRRRHHQVEVLILVCSNRGRGNQLVFHQPPVEPCVKTEFAVCDDGSRSVGENGPVTVRGVAAEVCPDPPLVRKRRLKHVFAMEMNETGPVKEARALFLLVVLPRRDPIEGLLEFWGSRRQVAERFLRHVVESRITGVCPGFNHVVPDREGV